MNRFRPDGVPDFRPAFSRHLIALLGVTLACLTVVAPVARPATIVVDSTAQEVTQANPNGIVNGNCTLGEAILAAVRDMAVDACTAGSGLDTIMIPAGTYTLTDVAQVTNLNIPVGFAGDANGEVGGVILQGAWAATTIIERSTATGTPDFIFLQITDAELHDLTFRNGRGTQGGNNFSPGGAINHVSGTSLVVGCVFDNNFGDHDGGAINSSNRINLNPASR